MTSKTVAAWCRELLYPAGCACCGAPLLGLPEAERGVCADCAALLRPEDGLRCVRCGRPLVSERISCVECREKEKPSFDAAFPLFRYGGLPRRFLSAYKFGTGRAASAFIAELFAEVVRKNIESIGAPFSIVPVPPRPGKLKKSGWDQVEAIAGRLERAEGFSVCRCLARLQSRTQKELNRNERSVNMRRNIVCVSPAPVGAVLIDDVLTTGATLDACAAALKKAGSRRVIALALCYD